MLKPQHISTKTKFAKNVLLLVTGTLFAQVINFCLSPVITRLYTPEDYGILAIYSSILGILAIIGSLKYESAIVIADNDEIAINVVGLCLIILLCFITFIIIILYLLGDFILTKLRHDIVIKYKYFIPLGVFFLGLYNIFLQWAYRKKNIRSISKTKFSQVLFNNFSKILLGFGKFKAFGLIVGNILGESSGLIVLSKPFFYTNGKFIKSIEWQKIRYVAERYIKFPLYTATSQLCNQAGLHLPALLMLSLYNSEIVGYYSLASTVLNLPMVLIGNSIGDAFYAEAASIGRHNPRQLKELSKKLFKRLCLIGIMPLVIGTIGGPFFFTLIFGTLWTKAGYFARIMTILIFSRLIFTPVSRLYSVFEKQKEAFIIDLLRMVFVLVIYFISKTFQLSVDIFLVLYSVALSFIYFLTYFVAQRIMENEIPKPM
ncbi:MAG: oligosaccharide flippase family protein [Bacteroidales bacterium]|jgi:O-antigen/teichoic acid export membrane protein|nr:oligosaccharide flippase family protein [Bacteroidales bacterium]